MSRFPLVANAAWALLVLLGSGTSALAEPDRVEEENCEAVQVIIRIPPQNIDPLVPDEFQLVLNEGMAGLAIGCNRCQHVRVFEGDRLVSDRETVFATLRVDVREPSWDVTEGAEVFHNYQLWIASDNKDLIRFFQNQGGNSQSQAVLVDAMSFRVSQDSVFSFDAPRPAPSPFRIVGAHVGPLDSAPLALTDAFWSGVRTGIMKEAAHQDLLQFGETSGRVEPATGSELARILCGVDPSFGGGAVGAITGDPHGSSVRTFFRRGGYTLDVQPRQASSTSHASCPPK